MEPVAIPCPCFVPIPCPCYAVSRQPPVPTDSSVSGSGGQQQRSRARPSEAKRGEAGPKRDEARPTRHVPAATVSASVAAAFRLCRCRLPPPLPLLLDRSVAVLTATAFSGWRHCQRRAGPEGACPTVPRSDTAALLPFHPLFSTPLPLLPTRTTLLTQLQPPPHPAMAPPHPATAAAASSRSHHLCPLEEGELRSNSTATTCDRLGRARSRKSKAEGRLPAIATTAISDRSPLFPPPSSLDSHSSSLNTSERKEGTEV